MDIVLGILGGVVGGLGFRAARPVAGKRHDWFDCCGVHRGSDPCLDHSVGQKSLAQLELAELTRGRLSDPRCHILVLGLFSAPGAGCVRAVKPADRKPGFVASGSIDWP